MNYENFETYELHPEVAHEFAHEMYETELAHELLNMQSEAELNHFLGGLISSAWRGAKALYNSPAGQAIKGQVVAGAKSLGRQALPALSRAVGGYFGGDTGAQLGNRFGSWAAGRFLNEAEYAHEVGGEQSIDTARRLIRTVRQASTRIAALSQSGRPLSRRTVRGIMVQAAQQNFPGIQWPSGGRQQSPTASGFASGASSNGQSSSGTWYRQGNQIVLSGV